MNRRKLEELIPKARVVLREAEVMGEDSEKNGKFRGQIAAFGASVAQGGLLAAISFFSGKDKGNADVDRSKLMDAIAKLLPGCPSDGKGTDALFLYVHGQIESGRARRVKEDVLTAAVALKLAMNLYDLGKGRDDSDSKPSLLDEPARSGEGE